jgi:hypothetical protein
VATRTLPAAASAVPGLGVGQPDQNAKAEAPAAISMTARREVLFEEFLAIDETWPLSVRDGRARRPCTR